ncbi:cyclase family protein [Methanolobus sp. ZRKC3]|uniref:cyclase family protein n=1 Tax=Methanolobus sp. ZRKC3 TaxID=3125786 RepID=UPI0032477044
MVRRIIDISVGISSDMPVYPGDPKPSIENVFSIDKDGFAVSKVGIGTHTGTHIDAPSHILKDGASIDMVSIDHFLGRAVVLDLSYMEKDISRDDLESCFKSSDVYKNAEIDILLLKTVMHSFEPVYSDIHGLTVGLDKTVGQWILEYGFRTVGIDTLSVDSDPGLSNHKLLLENDVCIIENLDLAEVRGGIYEFICFPLKLIGCDASPARAILIEI